MPEQKSGLDIIGERERARLVRIAYYFLRDLADAEDVVHASLLKALVQRLEFRNKSSAMTYLISVLRNEARMLMRNSKRELRAVPGDAFALERMASREVLLERQLSAKLELECVLRVLPVKFARVEALGDEPYDFRAARLRTTRRAAKLWMHRMRPAVPVLAAPAG